MQKLILLAVVAILFSCNQSDTGRSSADTTIAAIEGNKVLRGEEVDESAAITVPEMLKMMEGKDKLYVTIRANVIECCQKKGCWMKVDKGNGETMMVTFKDYGFFVPLESAGKTAIMKGFAYYDTISVEMLRHYAEDAGKSKEEIEAITEPEYDIAFEASGVVLK
jgi:hypothetical protein